MFRDRIKKRKGRGKEGKEGYGDILEMSGRKGDF